MGNPVAIFPLPSGVTFPRFYTRINPLTNAQGQPTDLITPDEQSVTVSGITDAGPGSGASVEAGLFGYQVGAGGLPELAQTGAVATSDLETTTDLHETDSSGNELYSFSLTLPTAGLAPGLYALQTFVYTPAVFQSNGVDTLGLVFQSDSGTVTVQEFVPFTYVVREDTEIVSAGAAQTDTAIYLPSANTSVQLSADGGSVVWTSGGDQYEENLQTGATINLTTTGQPVPALQTTLSPVIGGTVASANPYGPVNSSAYEAISYPSFTEGGVTFGAVEDFDFNANNGGQNPLPTVTDAAGDTAVLQPFGTKPTMVGYAAAASSNGNAVLVIDPYDVTYIPYGSSSATSASPQYYVVYRSPAPTLSVARVQGGGSAFEVVQGADGSETVSGTSSAIGQAVEVDLGVAGDEAATANVRADGTWQAVFTLAGYTGPTTLIVSVSSAAGTPTSVTGSYQVLSTPVVTFYLPTAPSNDDDAFIEGNALAGSTVTLYDTNGAVLGTTVTRSTGVFLFNSVILSEGSHAVTATATLNGVSSAASTPIDITIDLTPPAAVVTSLVVEGDNDVTLAEQAQPDVTVSGTLSAPLATGESVEVVGTDGTMVVATVGADGLSFTASLPTPGGSGTITAYTQDAAGNQTAAFAQGFRFDSLRAVVPLGQAITGESGFGSSNASLSDNGSVAAFTVGAGGERAALVSAAALPGGGAGSQVFVTDFATGATVEASPGSAGTDDARLSGDGTRLVVEVSEVGGPSQVALIDLAAGTTTVLSHAAGSPGTPSLDGAEDGVISQDGEHVAFDSQSPDLGGGAGGNAQVYEVDVAAGTTRLVSGVMGMPGNGSSYAGGVSGDGRVVVFESAATNLGPAVSGGSQQIYAASFDAGGDETITLVSASAAGVAGNDDSYDETVSANGRYVLFDSFAGNLVAGTSAGTEEVYRKDLQTGAIVLVSASAGGVAADDDSQAGGISDDGSLAVFASAAANLTGNADDDSQVFVKNLLTGALTLVSGSGLLGADGSSEAPAISGDGSTVAFESDAPDLVAGFGGGQQAYVAAVTGQIACFCAGTRIRTVGGEAPVERLAIGDLVVTAFGERRPVRWIGRRRYAGRFLAANPGVQPVRFAAGSLGAGVPRRDLFVSPEHAMFLDGVLIAARHLVNGASVTRERGWTEVAYFHVELDRHDVLLAEGAAAESFVDDDSRVVFHNAAEFGRLYPDAVAGREVCAPRVEHGEALEAVRRRIWEVAGRIGRVCAA